MNMKYIFLHDDYSSSFWMVLTGDSRPLAGLVNTLWVFGRVAVWANTSTWKVHTLVSEVWLEFAAWEWWSTVRTSLWLPNCDNQVYVQKVESNCLIFWKFGLTSPFHNRNRGSPSINCLNRLNQASGRLSWVFHSYTSYVQGIRWKKWVSQILKVT
jgi:hypothetical protein